MDKLLFTPGPLTTSFTVKQAMLHDLGSRDASFIKIVREIRQELLHLAHVSQTAGYEAVIIQGSGTFGIESVLSSSVPKSGRLLIVINGAYGERMAKIASIHQIPFEALTWPENERPDLAEIEKSLARGGITHLAIVHCETTSGIINPIEQVGQLATKYGTTYLVDSMSAFGAVPVNVGTAGIDFLISSSNKCIEGVPGFSFAIAKRERLLACKGRADTLALDLYAQWLGLENDGQFRFTPPTHSLLAFRQALSELKDEGGVEARAKRYLENFELLTDGMRAMGFKEYLPVAVQGYIINSFLYPEHPSFDFSLFYQKLNDRGFIIYPGKLSKANCFRIGNIGRIYPKDVQALLNAVRVTKTEMGF